MIHSWPLAILQSRIKIKYSSKWLFSFCCYFYFLLTFLSFTPPNYDTDPPSNFATGIQHPFAVQAILLWSGQHGVGLDSSHRHKNENRAPVTFITTIDENSHMLPGMSWKI